MIESQQQFIREQLEALAADSKIPPLMIDELLHLLDQYPSIEGHGRLQDLVRDLEHVFDSLERDGHIEGA